MNVCMYPFLTYGLISWGNTYYSTVQPLFTLQKRSMWVMTFSKFHEHSSPIFKHLNIVKLPDLVFLNIAVFMYKFHNRRLPSVFDTFFTQVNKRHNYNTRSASNMFYILPKVKTNYGIFNIRLKGPKVWNSIGENWKTFSISKFKESVKSNRGPFCVRMRDRWTSDVHGGSPQGSPSSKWRVSKLS